MGVYSSHGNKVEKVEALLRFLALCALALAAVLMATDNQTIIFLGVLVKKASFHCSKVFVLSVYLYTIGAGYTLAQLMRCLSLNKVSHLQAHKFTLSSHFLKWIHFLVDQIVVYVIFAVFCASAQFSLFAITGQDKFQWLKLCDKYRRFCFQFGGSMLCGFLAFLFLLLTSGVSSFNLFSCYSPNSLCLKPSKKISVVANTSS